MRSRAIPYALLAALTLGASAGSFLLNRLFVSRQALAFPIVDPGTGAVQSAGYPSWAADISVTTSSTSTTSGTASLSAGLYIIVCT